MDLFLVGLALAYFLVGFLIAAYSGTHPIFFFFLWPWPLAAHWVKLLTGEYPKWTPDL